MAEATTEAAAIERREEALEYPEAETANIASRRNLSKRMDQLPPAISPPQHRAAAS